MDDKRLPGEIPGFDNGFRCQRVPRRDDDLVAVLQDFAHTELLVGTG